MTTDKTLFVLLTTKPTVTVIAVGNGTVTIDNETPSSTVTKMFLPGESCMLYATPSTGYSFEAWYLDANCTNIYSSGISETVIVDESYTLYAKFTAAEYSITYYNGRPSLT